MCLERRSCEWARESRPERSRDPWAGVSQGQHWGLCQRDRGEVRLEPEEAIDMCMSVGICVKMFISVWEYMFMSVFENGRFYVQECGRILEHM